MADLIAAAFLLPLFDVGVVIPVRTAGSGIAILDAVGRIDYVQPGGATLGDRRVYTPRRCAQNISGPWRRMRTLRRSKRAI